MVILPSIQAGTSADHSALLLHLAFCPSPGFPTLVLVHLEGRTLHFPSSSGVKECRCQEYSVLVVVWRRPFVCFRVYLVIVLKTYFLVLKRRRIWRTRLVPVILFYFIFLF